ncbi:4010_t:CDS:2 [Paraglomus occultum]|uniref:4010_t:CDS:1 n=1 Tax=Paraglomus occultum TaxID=144539 RepID=A0A9N9ABS9_9GLOM|nr:4010_t:CDS:2 [Paraglomus occultum]
MTSVISSKLTLDSQNDSEDEDYGTIESAMVLIEYYNTALLQIPMLFSPDKKLSEVRNELETTERRGRPMMTDEMNFYTYGHYAIPREVEEKTELRHVLTLAEDNAYTLIIGLNYEDDSAQLHALIQRLNLSHGSIIYDGGLQQSQWSQEAFEFIDQQYKLSKQCSSTDYKVSCKTDYDIEQLHKIGFTGSPELRIPWRPDGLSLKAESWSGNDRSGNRLGEPTHTVTEFVKATLFMNKEYVRPSASFEHEVEQALSLDDTIAVRAKLMELCDRYGPFWPRKVQLGGRITKSELDRMTLGTNVKDSNIKERDIYTTVIGGNEVLYMETGDMAKWAESLNFMSSWKILRYEDVVIIFEIFDEETRNHILQAFWGSILYHDIQKVEAVFDPQHKDIYKRPIDIPEHLHADMDHLQVYVTLLRKDNAKDAFCISTARSFKGIPEVCIHYTGRKHIPPKTTKTFSLSLAVIVTGYPPSFILEKPNENFSVRSFSLPIQKVGNKFIAKIPQRSFKQTAILATCYTSDEAGQNNLMSVINKSNDPLIVGTHLHVDDGVKLCAFGYWVKEDGSYELHDKLDTENFQMVYSIISDMGGDEAMGSFNFLLKWPSKRTPGPANNSLETADYKAMTNKIHLKKSMFAGKNECYTMCGNAVFKQGECIPGFITCYPSHMQFWTFDDYEDTQGEFAYYVPRLSDTFNHRLSKRMGKGLSQVS